MLYCNRCGMVDTKRHESKPDSQGVVTVTDKCGECGRKLNSYTKSTRRPVPEPCG